MKKKATTFLFCFFILFSYSQNQDWVTVNNYSPSFVFSCPQNPLLVDTLHTKYYFYKLDTAIGFQVHIIDSAIFESNNEIFNEALNQTNGDTLRAITKIMLAFSNSELTSIRDINVSNQYSGLEVGIKYNDVIASRNVFSFIRFYRNNKEFISFTITGYEDDLDRLVNLKNSFFGSISFQ